MTVGEALARLERELTAAHVGSPRRDAELLLEHTLRLSRAELYSARGRELTVEQQRSLHEVEERRLRGEPVQYVVGQWGFRRLTLKVDSRALIPRPETEVLVERCLALLDGVETPRVLDVGVGSGAIALALAAELPSARIVAIDSSHEALALARENRDAVAAHGYPWAADHVELRHADLAHGLPAGPWDLVVSNPPYVPPGEYEGLAPEVREWEPRAALVDEGQTEAIARSALGVLRARGALALETHDRRAREVAALLEELGYADVGTHRDLSGRERIVTGRRP